jgi:hypothetical protein
MALDGKKTYAAAASAIVLGVAAWASGDATWWQGLVLVVAGGFGVGLRHAVAKSPPVLAAALLKVFAEVAASAPTTATTAEEK